MAEHLVEQVIEKLRYAKDLYYRLILVVGAAGRGKTVALQELAKHTNAPLVNLNLELSRLMLDPTERQRTLQVPRLLDQIAARPDSDAILLDNIELLFDVALKQDPLRLLERLSRNRTVVAAWNGSMENDRLIYAELDHPEYRCYPAGDFLVVNAEANGRSGAVM